MRNTRKIVAIATIPVLVGAWAAFRPELIFINKTVSEKLPVSSMTLASGNFMSYAHETRGSARLVSSGDKRYVQLDNFSTSNGPDVHLYLVSGSDASQDAVKKGDHLDLGTLKGNIGDQNYEIPTGVDLQKYRAVSIWCARFSVAFGGASLEQKQVNRIMAPTAQLAAVGSAIEVTYGNVMGDKRFSGRAAIIEDAGKRFVETNFKSAQSFELRLSKKESLAIGDYPKDTQFLSLGKAIKGKNRVSIPKNIDAWLYRSIAVIDANTGKISGFVLLRSAQEKKSLA